ncbi:MAG TPA: efflux RND transporter periplasmic adaptor subunit [Bacteroidetes bacterium]|nr:cobalt-zinc-cadmium resistance protein CzcB [bacterium BMS3Bbin04]HDO66331.1 efflux RND transporter periplasmic adaptor subunit [Bacteroidota bacterium]HEX05456.1 efflux RND transporter periplasmic adaptor subunit [Bacteroidota bacterium]
MNMNIVFRRFMTGGLIFLVALVISACQTSDEHADHEEHGHEVESEMDDHEELDETGVVHLDEATLLEFGVSLATAGPGDLHREISLPGEVRLDQNRIAHVTSRVPGNVFQVMVNEGDHVQRGQLLAVIHSEQLASTKSALLEARERIRLAQSTFNRLQTLREEGLASQEELQTAEREKRGAEISLLSTEQMLHALGIEDNRIQQIGTDPSVELSHHELLAPFDGRVIQREIVQGERVDEDTEAFIIADLSTVWVDARIYPRDLGIIREKMSVNVIAGYGIPSVSGTLSYVGPVVGEETRTAIARTEVTNPNGLLRPGLFVTVKVATESFPARIAIPRSAIVKLEGKPHVFVGEGQEFMAVEVVIGMETDTHVEIVKGLVPGQIYVSNNGFILKAEMGKGQLGDGHGH